MPLDVVDSIKTLSVHSGRCQMPQVAEQLNGC